MDKHPWQEQPGPFGCWLCWEICGKQLRAASPEQVAYHCVLERQIHKDCTHDCSYLFSMSKQTLLKNCRKQLKFDPNLPWENIQEARSIPQEHWHLLRKVVVCVGKAFRKHTYDTAVSRTTAGDLWVDIKCKASSL